MAASVGKRPGSEAEHEAAPGQVVEQHGPLGDPERVVIADADHAGAELDVAGPLGGRGDEDLGRGDDLAAGRVVLADPGLVPAQPVEVVDQLQIALERQRRVLPAGWNGAMKVPNRRRSAMDSPSCAARHRPG